jgi:hypothetical protein
LTISKENSSWRWKPGDAHRKLEMMAGSGREERMSPSPWERREYGGGRVQNRAALDGLPSFRTTSRSETGPSPSAAVFTWDATQQCYVLHWFDSMGTPPNEFKGSFQGKVLTMTSPMPQGQSRVVFDFSKDGKYVFRMDMSPDGREWQTMMDGSYERKIVKE